MKNVARVARARRGRKGNPTGFRGARLAPGGGLEVAGGVKQQLEADAKLVPGLRLLPGQLMKIRQAIGAPKGRAAAARYLPAFSEELKASGFVAAALKRHGIEGAAVAPPA